MKDYRFVNSSGIQYNVKKDIYEYWIVFRSIRKSIDEMFRHYQILASWKSGKISQKEFIKWCNEIAKLESSLVDISFNMELIKK